jgi:predicted negative regulator of RcsB-dependent stress response
VSEHLTRKVLKTDPFAESVGTTVDYLSIHRKQAIQIGAAVLIALIAGIGIYFWMEHARTVRQQKLGEAMQVMDAPVGNAQPSAPLSFPDQKAKDAAVSKSFSDIAARYHNSDEGAVAEYALASVAVQAGKNDEARKRFQSVVDSGSKEYASMAKLALAQLDFAENKDAEGEALLRDLIKNPTAMVSKEQATITLARQIGKKRPAEARALLTPLLTAKDGVAQIAQAAQTEIPAK